MVSLGIDIGQSLGWAVVNDGVLAAYGTLKLKRSASHAQNLANITHLVDDFQPAAVGIEDVQFSRFVQAHASYWRIRTLVELGLEMAAPDAPVHTVGVSTLKTWATGKGNATKPDMVRAATARGAVGLRHLEHPDVTAGRVSKAQAGRDQDMADAVMAAFWTFEVAQEASA